MGIDQATIQLTVGTLMNQNPVTLPPGARVAEAIRRFRDENPSAIAVVDAAGKLCGILTILDLLRAAGPAAMTSQVGAEALASQPVEAVMRPGVLTLEATDPLGPALELMVETRFHALPVVRRYGHGPVLVGMLEQRDLLPVLAGES